VVHLEEVRYPDDPKARAAAEEASLAVRRRTELTRFYDSLVKKYARIDKALLKKLDWEAKKPGYAALAKDQRPVVKIKGEKPVTVADLTAEMSQTFFHGAEGPIRDKRVNKEKMPALEAILVARLFAKEARALKLQDTPEVRRAVEENRRAVLFSLFLERVLAPEVKVTEADVQRYFEKHKAEYTYPQMFKLDGIAFTTVKGAQTAVEQLRSGTDFQWLRANADGQVKAEERSLPIDSTATISVTSLAPDLVKALAGAGSGDYRVCAAPRDQYYAIRVVESIPPRVQPYLEAREVAANAVYDEKLTAAIQDYADKLRAARDVEVYLTRIGN
jgi:hypothetical protein